MIKTRIILVNGWYYPQVYITAKLPDALGGDWHSIDNSILATWGGNNSLYRSCRHWTLWGAKRTLAEYLAKDKVTVVYESDA